MRFEFVRNLKGNEILGKEVLKNDGTVLLKIGTKLTRTYISKLRRNRVFFVYVRDNRLEDIKYDKKIVKLKQTALKSLPNMFKGLIQGDKSNIKESLKSVELLINYIIEEGSINTNLYEINQYDNYTYIHCVDTSIMATFLGVALKMDKNELKELGQGAILHDIGKTKISQKIINKKGPLTEEEYNEVKKHPIYGYKILKKSGINNSSILNGVLQHHERIDGKGYPYGLKGEDISKFARVITVCDVFTAISANRSYRKRFSPNEAYEYVLSGSGTMFDKDIIAKFRESFAVYPLGCCVRLSNEVEGYVIKQNKYFPDRPVIRVVYDSNTREPIDFYEIDLLKNTNLVIESII